MLGLLLSGSCLGFVPKGFLSPSRQAVRQDEQVGLTAYDGVNTVHAAEM